MYAQLTLMVRQVDFPWASVIRAINIYMCNGIQLHVLY